MAQKISLSKRYDALPKWIKVIPYIAGAGAVDAVLKHLTEVQIDDRVMMGLINVVAVYLVTLRGNRK